MPLLPSIERVDGQVIDQEALARRRRSAAARKDVRLCQQCGQRPAQYSDTGDTEGEGTHTLCFACFRAHGAHVKAPRLSDAEDRVDLTGLPPASASVPDREQLYSEIGLRLRRAQMAARRACESEPIPPAEPVRFEKAS